MASHELNGSEITLTAAGQTYKGTVEENSITGKIEGGGKWTAKRSS